MEGSASPDAPGDKPFGAQAPHAQQVHDAAPQALDAQPSPDAPRASGVRRASCAQQASAALKASGTEEIAAAASLASRALLWLPLPVFCVTGAVVTAGVVPFDQAIYNGVRRVFAPSTGLHDFVSSLSALGSWPAGAVVNLLMLLHPLRWRLLVGYAVPVLLCTLCVHGLKFVVGRARPQIGLGPWQFDLFSHPDTNYDSFPSGHALYAFVLAALLTVYLPRCWWVFMALAGMVALARVVCAAHWPSDTLAGAALGCLLVYCSVRAGGTYWYGLDTRGGQAEPPPKQT